MKEYVNTPQQLVSHSSTPFSIVWLKGNTRGRRNNNPCNIEYNSHNHFRGCLHTGRKDSRFCEFDSLLNGLRAVMVILNNYRVKGYCSVKSIIERWAPRSENNTKAYIDYIIDYMGDTVDVETGEIYGPSATDNIFISLDSVYSFRFYELVKCMCFYESGLDLPFDLYCAAHREVDFYNVDPHVVC